MTPCDTHYRKFLKVLFLYWLGLAGSGCSGEQFIEGQVIDYETRQPVAGVRVILQQTGWKFTGGVTWDHTYTFESVSDSQGNFRVVYDVGTSAKLRSEKEDYVNFDGWFGPNCTIVVNVKQKDPDYVRPQFGMLKLGIQGFKPFGWIFSEKRITFKPDEADVFPQFDSSFDRKNIGLTVTGGGGLHFVSEEKLGVRFDHLVYADQAPVTGYTDSARMDFNQKSAGVFFVRNRDGQHHAKFLFNSRTYGTEGGERGYKKGNWALMLEYVYNPDPSRNLRFEKTY
jgi:hypothetical protein